MQTVECKLTVVIPVYKVEDYIGQCVESVLNQTCMAHKVILVDDASPDRSGEIAENYAKKYPDIIRYIRQEKNKGLGAARNRGLEEVDTEYVTFLDSDDWLMPRYVEYFTQRMSLETENPELIFTLPRVYDMVTHQYQNWMDKPLFDALFSEPGAVINPQNTPAILEIEPNACRRIYSTEFLREQKFNFPEGTKWEDVEPHFQLLHAATRCIGIGDIGFCYRINRTGQITASSGADRFQVVSVFGRALTYAFKNGFSETEICYILRMAGNFSKWSIDCISVFLRSELIEKIHNLYKAVPNSSLKTYYKFFCLGRKEQLLFNIIRSPFYGIVGNAFIYKVCLKMTGRISRIINHRKR